MKYSSSSKLLSLFDFLLTFSKKCIMKKKIEMKVVNPHKEGIDIGSRSHLVAVGQDINQIKELGVSLVVMKK